MNSNNLLLKSKLVARLGQMTFLTAAALLVTACSTSKLPPLDPEIFISDLEKAIARDYVYSGSETDSPRWSMDMLYSAALQSLGQKTEAGSRAALLDYLKKMRPEELRPALYTALRGFLNALPVGKNDFGKPESLKWARDPDRSAGVGMVLRMTDPGKFLILDCLEGSAAHRENIQSGLFLEKVDGREVGNMDLDEVVGRIRGPADSEVKINYGGRSATLVRTEVVFRNIVNVSWNLPDESKVEYILLRSTVSGTANQVQGLISGLGPRKALIIDLRKLHQGDFEESFRTADLFVGSGRLGSMMMRNEPIRHFDADVDRIYTGKVYLILGKNSSPFAETLAMAMLTSPDTILMGQDFPGNGFIAKVSNINGGIELRLTGGLILNSEEKPLYSASLPIAVQVDDYLPVRPILSQPDNQDPAQNKLAEILGIK